MANTNQLLKYWLTVAATAAAFEAAAVAATAATATETTAAAKIKLAQHSLAALDLLAALHAAPMKQRRRYSRWLHTYLGTER